MKQGATMGGLARRFGVVLGCLLAAWLAAAPASAEEKTAAAPTLEATVPATGAPSGGANESAVAGGESKAKIEISIPEEKRYTINCVAADVRDVIKALSEKSGVQIEVFEGVKGNVTLALEKAPLEKVVDSLLSAIGQRNYLMVFDGGELTKMSIVPKDGGGKGLSEAAKRVKVKGLLRDEDVMQLGSEWKNTRTSKVVTRDLRTGAEIEYYPGEIVVPWGSDTWLGEQDGAHKAAVAERLQTGIARLERKFGLSLIGKSRVSGRLVLHFRILNGREVLGVMYDLKDGGYTTMPNGLGPMSAEMPRDGFHQYRKLSKEDYRACAARGLGEEGCSHEANPFFLHARIDGFPWTYAEGSFSIHGAPLERVLSACSQLGCLVMDSSDVGHAVLFPEVKGEEGTVTTLHRLRDVLGSWNGRAIVVAAARVHELRR